MQRTKTMVNAKKLVILTAGGTGGHIYPAEALARKLKDRGYELIFITATFFSRIVRQCLQF